MSKYGFDNVDKTTVGRDPELRENKYGMNRHFQNVFTPLSAGEIHVANDDNDFTQSHNVNTTNVGNRNNCNGTCCGRPMSEGFSVAMATLIIGCVLLPFIGLGLTRLDQLLFDGKFEIMTSLPPPANYSGDFFAREQMTDMAKEIIALNKTIHSRFSPFINNEFHFSDRNLTDAEQPVFTHFVDLKDLYYYQYELHQMSAEELKAEGTDVLKPLHSQFRNLIIADFVFVIIYVGIGSRFSHNLPKYLIFTLFGAVVGFGIMYSIASSELYEKTLHDYVNEAVGKVEMNFGLFLT